ncbi:MAG TPA: alpha/beta hydrolase [Burkholderiales bacterium]|nr:alpha/beta hydrolase [Burkholderiales bacterium]
MRILAFALSVIALTLGTARAADRVIDIPTRPGVTQRFVLISPPDAKAAVVLFAGGHGGLQISDSGAFAWGRGNFLVRSAPLFARQQLVVAIIDAPSDRQSHPYLMGFRQTPEHAADVKAVIAWLREHTKLPVWLVGTSRGTQSAAGVAVQLGGTHGPDGLVLTATLFGDARGRPVPEMPVDSLRIPVLVVHHEQDECRYTLFRDAPQLMDKLTAAPRKELVSFRGGESYGNPCEGQAYHGFRGLEEDVVSRISSWILTK